MRALDTLSRGDLIRLAERSLRHLVTSRKLSGGSRSGDGTATKMALASFFGTGRDEDINPYIACRDLLATHV